MLGERVVLGHLAGHRLRLRLALGLRRVDQQDVLHRVPPCCDRPDSTAVSRRRTSGRRIDIATRGRDRIIGRAVRDCRAVSCRHADGNRGPHDRRSRGDGHQPAQGLLPGDRAHQARPRPLLPGRRGRSAARRRRPADGAQAVRGRRRRRAVLPEAGAGEPARLHPDRDAHLPIGPDRRRDRHRRRGRPRLGRQPRLHRPQPAPGPGRGPRPPRRAAGRPRPGPGRAVGPHPARRARDARGARGGRARRLAEDVGLARDPRQRPDRAALDVPGGPPGGPRARP